MTSWPGTISASGAGRGDGLTTETQSHGVWPGSAQCLRGATPLRRGGDNMLSYEADTLQEMVNLREGTISREVFVNQDIYQQELEQIFARAWLFVGHESQVPKAGDYFQSRMGEEAVLLVRDRRNELHVFLNTCRHRGMKVCRYDEGNTLLFTCPFHGWSYDTDGRLVGVPESQTAYHGELGKAKGALPEARIANYSGS